MSEWKHDDPFEVLVLGSEASEFSDLTRRPVTQALTAASVPGAATARLHGFDLDERPLLLGIRGLGHEIVPARTTVQLTRQDVGADVVVLFDQGEVRRPIVVGVLQQSRSSQPKSETPAAPVVAQVDDQMVVLTAEREIVLRCGDASITLTRSGKVLIRGTYILSRSSGYNRIKGAAVDIN